MRIAYLSKSELPSDSANSIQVVKTCESMARAGHDVLLVGIKTEGSLDELWANYDVKHKFKVQRFAREFGLPNLFWEAIESVLDDERGWEHLRSRFQNFWKQKNPRKYCWRFAFQAAIATWVWKADLVYGRDPWSLWLAGLLRKPLVLELHKSPPPRIERLATSLIRKRNFRRLVVISEALGSHCLQRFSELGRAELVVAPDGASPISRVRRNPPESGRLRVGYTGSLNPGKGADFLCELVLASPEFDFHIGGAGPSYSKLAQLALGIGNLKLYGHLSHDETRTLQATMDVLLAPYAIGKDSLYQWMSPLKIFEYMSTGIPILASDLPVLREVLENEKSALLIPPEDLAEWRSALMRIKNDYDLGHELGENARSLMLSLYTWEKRLETILAGLP